MSVARAHGSARPHGWAQAAERGSLLGIRFGVWCYRAFGPRLTAILLYPIVAYFWLVAPSARRASRDYFERLVAAGAVPEGLGHRFGRTFWHFHTFAELILDRFCFWTGRYEQFEVEIHGRESMEPLIEAGRGAVLLGAHLGSFDVLRVIARDASIRVNVVMFTANARRINDILAELDPSSAVRIIEIDPTSVRAALEIKACIDRGEFVAMLGDRVPPGTGSRQRSSRFLGANAVFPEGPFLVPIVLRAPVVLCLALKRDKSHYDIFLETLAEAGKTPNAQRDVVLQDRVDAYAARLEHYTRMAPFQWFNFYDFWRQET